MDRRGRNRRKRIIIIKNVVFSDTKGYLPPPSIRLLVGKGENGDRRLAIEMRMVHFPVRHSDVGRLTGTRGPSEKTGERR